MSYIVLARKYRPKNFSQLIGQTHIVKALTNALTNNRLHHAYLLTGTRGVGKTTLGRILAKCLNCETGITATPCEICASCQEIAAGQSLDLIEIDAASNTKVEDTRDLLDNVQYAPSRDRFKIYLIDEVHMLSTHSFNALLKTLEEPPEHVKFILATTDPQKLPITVLSRCLQFNLRAMPENQISEHLATVLQQEKISAEPVALAQLAQAADGSMRDALSLLDQAIAYSNSNITALNVQAMLGNVDNQYLFDILTALTRNDATKIFDLVNLLAEQAVDYEQILDSLLRTLHHIAVAQIWPQATQVQMIIELAKLINKESIQLYYQIGLIGKRDLPLAPAPKAGFEMILLRMLSFVPNNAPTPVTTSTETKTTPAAKSQATQPAAASSWEQLIQQANLSGVTKLLASHCSLRTMTDNAIELEIDSAHSAMASPVQQQKLQEALQHHLATSIRLTIHKTGLTQESPAMKQQREQTEKQKSALENLNKDPHIQSLISQFDASIQAESIIVNE